MRKTTLKRQLVLTSAVLAGLGAAHAHAATLFWDANGASTGTGGTGAWNTTDSTWRDGSATGTLGAWVDGNDAVLPNSSGTLTIDTATTITTTSLRFANTTGAYTVTGGSLVAPLIRLDSGTQQIISSSLLGPTTIQHTGVSTTGTNLALAGANNFGGGALTLGTAGTGGTNFNDTNRIDLQNPNALGGASSLNMVGNFNHISATPAAVNAGGSIVNIVAPINLSTNASDYLVLSAPLGVQLSFAGGGVISGNSNVAIGTGVGAIVFAAQQTYTGETRIMNSATGLLRFLDHRVIPAASAVVFGNTGVNAGGINLNGFDQTIASLATHPGTTNNGIRNNGAGGAFINPATGLPAAGAGRTGESYLTINGSATTTFSDPIGGSVGFGGGLDNIQLIFPATNTGNLTVTNGNNSYSMGTLLNGGTVISRNSLNNFTTSPVGTGPVTVTGSATFGGSGQVIGATSLSGTSHLAPGGVAAVDPSNPIDFQTSLTLDSGTNVDFDFFSAGSDRVNTFTLNIPTSGADVNLNLNDDNGVGYSNGTFPLIDYATLVGDYNFLTLNPPADAPAGATFTLQHNEANGSIDVLIAGAAANRTWTGAVNGNWDVGSPSTGTQNWSGPSKFFNGDFVTFTDTASNFDIVVDAAGVSPGQMTVASGTYTFSNAAGSTNGISGGVNVAKQGGGTLTFNSPNTYTGGTTVTDGTLAFGPNGTAGSGAITVTSSPGFTNSTLVLTAGSNIATVPSVTLTNSTLRGNASLVSNRPITLAGATANIEAVSGTTMELSGTLSGATKLTKKGDGTLKLSAAGSGLTGGVDVDFGTLALSGVNATGTSGAGSGTMIVKTGTTLDVQGVRLGYVQATGATGGGSGLGTINLKNGSTLSFSGESGMSSVGGQGIQFQNFVSGTPSSININTGPANSRFAVRNFIKNETFQSNTNTVVHLQGNGIFQLATGSLSTSGTNLQYTGTWSLEMGSTGVMSIGPIISNNNTEVLNAPGFNLTAPFGETRPFTVVSGTLAVGADEKNPNVTGTNTTTGVFRSPVTLKGGNIASTGRKYTAAPVGSVTASSNDPVAARYGAGITLFDGTTSKALLYDPVADGNLNGTATLTANPSGPRNLRFVTDTAVTTLASPFNWGNNTTLIADSGTQTGGVLSFERTTGAVTVGSNVTLQINAGGTARLAGTVDALSDSVSSNRVNVVNAGALEATAGTKNVGNVTGAGSVSSKSSATLIANHVRGGGALAADNATIQFRSTGGSAAGVSSAGTVAITGTGKIDLTDNKLITTSAAGTATEGVYDGLQGQVQSAYNFGSWNGPGLTTSMQLALDGIATIGVATGEQIRGLGSTDTDVWAGQTINGASTIAMYTYAGDANLDGQVDAGDYGILDAFIQVAGATGYGNGDFNYDGFIDAADYGTIDNSIQFQGPPIFTSGGAGAGAASLSGVTAVPEPASLSVLGVAAASLLGRRRRRTC